MKIVLAASAIALASGALPAHAQVSQSVVKEADLDYANAKPKPLPQSKIAPGLPADLGVAAQKAKRSGEPKFEPGGKGDGQKIPEKLPESRFIPDESVESQQFGTSNHPFTTAVEPDAGADLHAIAGKLFFKDGGSTFVCSGALIKPGIVATAAHCVSEFGKGFFTGFEFVPGYDKGKAPYGRYKATTAYALSSYLDGTDTCSTRGVVCENDVAVLVLKPLKGKFPGKRTGWFGYGINGYGFTSANQTMITQLGYPVALNKGERQERTDSQGYVDPANANNTIIGSLQTGGSSGGPWLNNFGFKPKLTGTTFGTFSGYNIVVGTTSWGFTNPSVKQQGASPFTSGNIETLVKTACAKYADRCK